MKWSPIFNRYYVEKWYKSVYFDKFLTTRTLEIPNIAKLRRPANSVIRLLYKAQQLKLDYILPDGMVFFLAQSKIRLDVWKKFSSLQQKYKMELTSRFIFEYIGESKTPYQLIVHPNYDSNYDYESDVETGKESVSSISHCLI